MIEYPGPVGIDLCICMKDLYMRMGVIDMGNFDWELWLKKGIKKVGFGIAIGALTELSAFLGTEPVPSEYVWLTVGGVLVAEWILNALKHGMLDY